MKRWEQIYIYLCLTIMASGTILFGYWLFMPGDIMTITEPVTVDKKVYYVGDRITYTISYCKTRKIPERIIRALVDGTRLSFTEISTDLPVGCHKKKEVDLVIPDFLDADTYHIEASMVYRVNPVRSFIVDWRSEDFKVVRKKELQ